MGGGDKLASLREDYLNQVQRDFLSRTSCDVQHPQRMPQHKAAAVRIMVDVASRRD
jgi:hypothetical protein